MRLSFSKLLGKHVKYVSIYTKGTLKRSAEDLSNDTYAIFSDYKSICCGYSFELPGHVEAIQMSTHNICLSKEVNKKYNGYNRKTAELIDCALIGACVVIRSNTMYFLILAAPCENVFADMQIAKAHINLHVHAV